MLRCNVTPYNGESPYLFISYSHKEEDKSLVYPLIECLAQEGFRVWFDQGIEATSEWASEVSTHLTESTACIFCLSQNFFASDNCRDELFLAKNEKISRVSLFLKSGLHLDKEMVLGLVRQQQLFLENYKNVHELVMQLKKDRRLQPCLETTLSFKESINPHVNNIRRELQDETLLAAKQAYKACDFSNAIELYRKAYNDGNSTAGTLLAEMYFDGHYCPQDYDQASSIFVDCMHLGNPLATEWLARCYHYGRSVPKDTEKACTLFSVCRDALEEMAIFGSEDAQFRLGLDFLYGQFTDYCPQRGLFWLQKAAKNGFCMAGYHLAKAKLTGNGYHKDVDAGIAEMNCYTKDPCCAYLTAKLLQEGIDGRMPDDKAAFDLFMFAAKNGHIWSQYYLADCYRFGKGTNVDYTKSLHWYKKADRNGNIASTNSLGIQYLFAQGVHQDTKKAISYFKRSSKMESPVGQYMLGYIYCGMTMACRDYKNLPKAVSHLLKAANQGHMAAIRLLLKCYYGALGREVQDWSRYYDMLQKAADMEDSESMYKLGRAFIDGSRGAVLFKDPIRGTALIECAAEKKYDQAILYLAEMAITADPPQEKKGLFFLQQAEKVLCPDDKEKSPVNVLCKLGELYLSLGCPDHTIESITNTSKKANLDTHLHYLSCAYHFFFTALRKDPTSDTALYWMSFLQFFGGFKNEIWDDDFLLDKLKLAASDEFLFAFLLGTYDETHGITDRKRIFSHDNSYQKVAALAYLLGRCCVKKHIHGEDAMEVLKPSKWIDDPEACYLLGYLYHYGLDVKKDHTKAKSFLSRSANKGNRFAAADFAAFYAILE